MNAKHPRRFRPGSQAPLGWLGSDATAASVLATARRYMQIRHALINALPDGLGQICQVVKLDAACLTIAVPNGAHAAKLRQLAPRLADTLARAGWNVDEIKIRVLAGSCAPPPYCPPAKEAIPLDGQALQAFSALGEQLQPGPLADAVARLIKHHGPTGKKP